MEHQEKAGEDGKPRKGEEREQSLKSHRSGQSRAEASLVDLVTWKTSVSQASTIFVQRRGLWSEREGEWRQ